MVFAQGDIVQFDLSPSQGHEPKGRRPALVVSSYEFNLSTSMTLVCPVTSTDSGFPLHFALPESLDTRGFVALEQVRAYDLEARNAKRIEAVSPRFMAKVCECLRSFY